MPAVWDISRERRLLLHVIEITNPKPPSWAAVADLMGDGFSAEACRQHYNKIKRETKGTTTATSTPTITPSKPKATKATTAKAKPASRKRKASEALEDDDEGVMKEDLKVPRARKFENVSDDGVPTFKTENGDPNEPIDADEHESLYE
ncbi:MAG: hypothetical protein M1816_000751 [Peltula sp. TS41687]|nr:MAG: hypothetical protein M1816_000751 [Peltula sp. TS41687]